MRFDRAARKPRGVVETARESMPAPFQRRTDPDARHGKLQVERRLDGRINPCACDFLRGEVQFEAFANHAGKRAALTISATAFWRVV